MALILFALAAWIAATTNGGYRTGSMPFIWLGGINPLQFNRASTPVWFWGATAINVAAGAGLALAAILLLAIGNHP